MAQTTNKTANPRDEWIEENIWRTPHGFRVYCKDVDGINRPKRFKWADLPCTCTPPRAHCEPCALPVLRAHRDERAALREQLRAAMPQDVKIARRPSGNVEQLLKQLEKVQASKRRFEERERRIEARINELRDEEQLRKIRARQARGGNLQLATPQAPSAVAHLSVPEQIEYYRRRCGWSPSKLATMTPFDRATVSRHRRGLQGLREDNLRVYERVFSSQLGEQVTLTNNVETH